MPQENLVEFFQALSNLMLSIEVTDANGKAFSLAQGGEQASEILTEVKRSGNKVMLVGNGGSSAIVSHAHNDLCKSVGVRAMVFNEQPLLTAYANDDGYGSVFEQPIAMWGEPGDLLLTVSSSGKSENIIRAINEAKGKSCQIITLSGFSPDNPSRQMGDLNFYVNSNIFGYVESAHASLAHYITNSVTV